VRNLKLAGLWGADYDSAFSQIKTHLARAVTIAHPKQGYSSCLFTDASDTH